MHSPIVSLQFLFLPNFLTLFLCWFLLLTTLFPYYLHFKGSLPHPKITFNALPLQDFPLVSSSLHMRADLHFLFLSLTIALSKLLPPFLLLLLLSGNKPRYLYLFLHHLPPLITLMKLPLEKPHHNLLRILSPSSKGVVDLSVSW
jgi:hypothetical protein